MCAVFLWGGLEDVSWGPPRRGDVDGWTEGFRRCGRHAGAPPKLLGNAATVGGDGERRRERSKGHAMPAVEGLGRASPPLSVWLRAAAPEEIKKWPGMAVEAVEAVDGDELCLGSEKTRDRKSTFKRLRTGILTGPRTQNAEQLISCL